MLLCKTRNRHCWNADCGSVTNSRFLLMYRSAGGGARGAAAGAGKRKTIMRQVSMIMTLLVLLSGCTPARDMKQPAAGFGESEAITSLNRQIEKFNAERKPGTMGISPIDQRVSRVRHDPKLGQVACFSKDGKVFLVLKREPDGRFKGVLEVPYHQLVGSGPDGSHSWGHVLAEFYLEKGMFGSLGGRP